MATLRSEASILSLLFTPSSAMGKHVSSFLSPPGLCVYKKVTGFELLMFLSWCDFDIHYQYAHHTSHIIQVSEEYYNTHNSLHIEKPGGRNFIRLENCEYLIP